jgi:hypothetical protein
VVSVHDDELAAGARRLRFQALQQKEDAHLVRPAVQLVTHLHRHRAPARPPLRRVHQAAQAQRSQRFGVVACAIRR